HRRSAVHADEAFLFGDVLQQEVLYLLVRAVGVDRRDPLREVADVVVVLLDPFAEQAPVELAGGPRLAPRMHRRMALLNRVFQSLTECTLGHGAPPRCIQWSELARYLRLSQAILYTNNMKSEDYAQGDAFQAEKRTIFSTEWLPVCAEAQIAGP